MSAHNFRKLSLLFLAVSLAASATNIFSNGDLSGPPQEAVEIAPDISATQPLTIQGALQFHTNEFFVISSDKGNIWGE